MKEKRGKEQSSLAILEGILAVAPQGQEAQGLLRGLVEARMTGNKDELDEYYERLKARRDFPDVWRPLIPFAKQIASATPRITSRDTVEKTQRELELELKMLYQEEGSRRD